MIYLKIYHQLPNSLQMINLFFFQLFMISSLQLYDDLIKIFNFKLGILMKISFNREVNKQAQEVVFLVEARKSLIPQFISITLL